MVHQVQACQRGPAELDLGRAAGELLQRLDGRDQRADLVRYATDLGLPREAFERCLDERRFASSVEADVAQARALGVRSTPTFFINGRPLVGAQPVENFRGVIDDALRTTR